MREFICPSHHRILLLVSAILGMTSLLLSWLSPPAAFFTAISVGVVCLVSAVIFIQPGHGSAESAARSRITKKNQQRRRLGCKTLTGFAS